MGDNIVEPIEIITNREEERVSHANPALRLLARFFDYALLFLALLYAKSFYPRFFPFSLFDHVVPFEFLAWIPIESVLLSVLGTTPGKFLLKTKLQQGRRKRLLFSTALKRSLLVWFRGLGMGIPIINIICMSVASSRLRILGTTSWDREENIMVSHFPLRQWRIVVAFFVVLISFSLYYGDKYGIIRVAS